MHRPIIGCITKAPNHYRNTIYHADRLQRLFIPDDYPGDKSSLPRFTRCSRSNPEGQAPRFFFFRLVLLLPSACKTHFKEMTQLGIDGTRFAESPTIIRWIAIRENVRQVKTSGYPTALPWFRIFYFCNRRSTARINFLSIWLSRLKCKVTQRWRWAIIRVNVNSRNRRHKQRAREKTDDVDSNWCFEISKG